MQAAPNIQTPAARSSDPETSHLAAEAITRDGTRTAQQKITLDALRRHPGQTSSELAKASGLDRYMLARRLPELAPMYVTKGVAIRCPVTGHQAHIWWPVEQKDAAA